ncbi:TPA: LLM class flavin-dependent oxidoreductase [Staphylococcus aureus]|nr:LLM class flavin-dependent oxidoreductase [Staphylococcus aureus]
MAIKYSALNLVPIREGDDEQTAINDMVNLAQHLDELSYERYWIAEHHNAPNLVSSATALLIQHTLEHTKHIRVGSGGIMLPNHAPLIVAEQFGTMATLFPNRVDLGLGRAPGTDMMTASALRRDQHDGVYKFPEEVSLLQQYFGPAHQQAYVRAYPAVGKNVPLYILGSSTDSAHLAARKGLPYVFAGHFAPQQMKEAIEIYKTLFEPSDVLDEPYVIVCLNTIVAENDDEAQYLELQNILTPREYAMAMERQKISLIGSENTVQQKIQDFMETYGEVNEIMAISYIYDKDMQLDSYRRFKNVINQINEKNTL